MKKNIAKKGTLVLSVLFSLVIFDDATASPLDNLRIVKISASDGTAVIRIQDSNLQIIKRGDEINKIGKVIEISENRIVFEAKTGVEEEKIVIRMQGGKQRIERIKSVPDIKDRPNIK